VTVFQQGELNLKEGATRFSREFKVAALQRMLAGENVSALARELGIRRKYLYQWRDRFRTGGPDALRGQGRPPREQQLAMPAGRAREGAVAKLTSGTPNALAASQRRIGELERKIGAQQVELDFFRQALRQVRGARQASDAPGAAGSTRSSKR
jgi:transposase-like protein